MNERFNEKSQDKDGHKATYTCFKNTYTQDIDIKSVWEYTFKKTKIHNTGLNQHGPVVV